VKQNEPAHRWGGLDEVPAGFGPSAVTIGNFDGVHRGHLAVLRSVVERAREAGLLAVAITFDPHPLAVLHPDRAPEPLSTIEHKLEQMGAAGLDAVLVMPFTHELARWSPERFVREVIVEALGAKEVVVGSDTRFGYRNAGDVNTLRELGEKLGFAVRVLADLGRLGPERRWSSTWVRELIAEGDVAAAAEVLGRPHRITGAVVHGDHRGRELGYPTANLAPDAVGAVPADGVYAGWLVRSTPPVAPSPPSAPAASSTPSAPAAASPSSAPAAASTPSTPSRLPAAVSIGTNPTFDGAQRRVEAYVLDRTDLDLYGEVIAVEFVERLRPTLRFAGIEPLVQQMADDVTRCREVLGVGPGE
jgi:riboflavin kinase / FMN adenylyltransferase